MLKKLCLIFLSKGEKERNNGYVHKSREPSKACNCSGAVLWSGVGD